MRDVEAILKHVKHGCKTNGKQFTAKRLLILRALVHADKALSAYEIVDYCKEHFDQNVQAMSVYRVLEFLEEHHLAHKLKVSNKFILCDHILCEHEHGIPQFLICSKCDKISEQTIHPAIIRDLQSHAKQEGFTVVSPQLEISCVCDECANQDATAST
ncbi:Fur family transcriptional regulator, zinc uptake regulator [Vibrio crassostreae]|uniref:Fur family transcriptional regulator n=1 Tax=Vibrio crassostreae TaxID=246167 RepID=UPI001B3101C5|nr:transcriptional repressor [Vibrio crassostreae]CAK1844419.1 Fur family transcriptional regulator, zinc uptake regulator [Vibrio crassostreae]CAK1849313.1 Fur family transcriptional regulator, zinc uptake regulator [Vibrio crassostreae]CAK1849528.1 Fur family transcriptional regulator, zinc uptake regulator [Vibrio crassostreae]CAK1849584.1 Fur family transcriptional regulator, zinc uptake regulator [Vibrio crassostreae]CAK1851194.1 Fur family transcriptional regulator, zinc uptake regulator